MATAFCMKCKKKVEIKNPSLMTVEIKNPSLMTVEGVQQINGVCPVCGARIFRVGKT